MASELDAEQAILDLLAARGPGKTICPSEAARLLGGDDAFRPLMPIVRAAAAALHRGPHRGDARRPPGRTPRAPAARSAYVPCPRHLAPAKRTTPR